MDSEHRADTQRRTANPATTRLASLPLRHLLATAASFLPAETRVHARASAREGLAAVRSLADGASELTERAIDRVSLLFGRNTR